MVITLFLGLGALDRLGDGQFPAAPCCGQTHLLTFIVGSSLLCALPSSAFGILPVLLSSHHSIFPSLEPSRLTKPRYRYHLYLGSQRFRWERPIYSYETVPHVCGP